MEQWRCHNCKKILPEKQQQAINMLKRGGIGRFECYCSACFETVKPTRKMPGPPRRKGGFAKSG